MAGYFLDSSAIVKRYVVEVGTPWINRLLRSPSDDHFFAAWIAGPETVSALTCRARRGELSPDETDECVVRFQREWRGLFHLIDLTTPLLLQAMKFAHRYGLRGYDSVQLSAAVQAAEIAKDADIPQLTFVSSDFDLNAAAREQGFRTEDPLRHAESSDHGGGA